jgi:hypothetical protein
METQQMKELLLARIDANTKANQEDLLARMEAKINASRKAVREEMMKANQGKVDADQEHMQQMMAIMDECKSERINSIWPSGNERSKVNARVVDMKDD